MKKITQFTNHVALVVDASGSMATLHNATVKAFDGLITSLVDSSKRHNQETRVSVYLFDDVVEVLAFDMDVMRMPSLKDFYYTRNMTALATATNTAWDDLEKVPELYTDHGFIIYTLTDGGENRSGSAQINRLAERLGKMKENWTIVAHVPNSAGREAMFRLGYNRGNVAIWDTTEEGMKKAVELFTSSTDNYMVNRTKGIRGSSTYFQVDASKLTVEKVKTELSAISARKYKLIVNPESKAMPIRELVERSTGRQYELGKSFFSLVKNETVQAQKQILVKNKQDGKIYGPDGARELIGLTTTQSVMVRPTLSPNFDIYVQSTSVNRNIIPKQEVIVLS